MAKKGIYQRYECITTNKTVYVSAFVSTETISGSGGYRCNTSYIFNEITGLYTLTGTDNHVIYSNGAEQGSGYSVEYPGTSTAYGASGSGLIYASSGRSGGAYPQPIVNQTRYKALAQVTPVYSRGTYLTDIIADYGSLPADGRHTDGYWYVFSKMASDLKGNVDGFWRDTPTGWSNVNGIWKPQNELKSNVNGIYK